MGHAYAFVQRGVVLDVERRTLQDTGEYPIGKYYHGALLPFFVELRPGENAPAQGEVKRGWVYSENSFHEPAPFEMNDSTGELYLPPSISAEMFWQTFSDNIRLRGELATTTGIVNNMLLEQLTAEGVIV